MSGPNPSHAMLLEEPLIRTPYELLRRSHRSAQRQVEKDFIGVQSLLQGLSKTLNASKGEVNDDVRASALGKLDQASERFRGLKRKLDDLQPNSNIPTPLRQRLEYLDKVASSQSSVDVVEVKVEERDDKDGIAERPTAVEGTGSETVAAEDGKDQEGDIKMETDDQGHPVLEAQVVVEGNMTPPILEQGGEADRTLDRFIIDHLLRTGRIKTAKALAEKEGIEHLVDIKLFAELIKIENALIDKHSCTEALAWCGENRGTLKKTKNNLEFTLRLQEFIELCRQRDTAAAISYSRKNLSPWAQTHMTELRQGMALLAFGERTGVELYRKLYDPTRWSYVRDQFRETFLGLYALPSQSLLALSLAAGLSSLRVPSCVRYERPKSPEAPKSPSIPLLPAAPPLHNLDDVLGLSPADFLPPIGGLMTPTTEKDLHNHPDATVGNVDCPTCGEDMKVLASEVPMSHHTNSTIVCRISGEVMDSQNGPMAFPNGYVYSHNALAEMAKNNFGVVTCPRTRDTCAFSKLRKVYIS